LNTSHLQNTTALASLAEEHLKWDEEEVLLRRNVQEKEEMRAWFGTFHDRMEEVGEFLEEKVRSSSPFFCA
jgi:GC-rich sequence DNA-binding factor